MLSVRKKVKLQVREWKKVKLQVRERRMVKHQIGVKVPKEPGWREGT